MSSQGKQTSSLGGVGTSVRRYEAQNWDTLPDTIKAAILAYNPQDSEWCRCVRLSGTRLQEYDALKSEWKAMETTKRKGKEKGKRKGKEKGKRKDKSKERTSDTSNTKCSFCKRNDCLKSLTWPADKKTMSHELTKLTMIDSDASVRVCPLRNGQGDSLRKLSETRPLPGAEMQQRGMRQMSCDSEAGRVTTVHRALDMRRSIWSLKSMLDSGCDVYFAKDRCQRWSVLRGSQTIKTVVEKEKRAGTQFDVTSRSRTNNVDKRAGFIVPDPAARDTLDGDEPSVRIPTGPVTLSAEEKKLLHKASGHAPHRRWCRWCAAVRTADEPHLKKQHFLSLSFMFWHFLSCSGMFFHVLSCSFMFFHVLSCSFMFFHVLSCSFMFFHVLSCSFYFLSFSFFFIHFHSFSFIFFHFLSFCLSFVFHLSFIFLSFSFIFFHVLSFSFIFFHFLSFSFFFIHFLSFSFIFFHFLSFSFILSFICLSFVFHFSFIFLSFSFILSFICLSFVFHFSFIFFHFLSFSFIFFHFLSFSFIFFHFLSFPFISFHFLSFSFIFLHFPSFSFIFFHFLSFSFIF